MKNNKNAKTSTSKKASSNSTTSRKSVKKASPSNAKRSSTSAKSSSRTTSSRSSSRQTTSKKSPSQSEVVLNHLISKGSINTKEAIDRYGIYRLGAVIHNLKKNGIEISTGTYEFKNKLGAKTTVAKYIMS